MYVNSSYKTVGHVGKNDRNIKFECSKDITTMKKIQSGKNVFKNIKNDATKFHNPEQ